MNDQISQLLSRRSASAVNAAQATQAEPGPRMAELEAQRITRWTAVDYFGVMFVLTGMVAINFGWI